MPPDLASDIVDNGLVLTGGGALLRGLDIFLQNNLQLPVRISEDPLLSVARGTAMVLEDKKLLKMISND